MGKDMPPRYMYRDDQMASGDYQTINPLGIMDPEFEDPSQTNATYHEMDFTYLSPSQHIPASISSPRLAKYPTMEMDEDDMCGLRPNRIGYMADPEPGSTTLSLSPTEYSYSHQLNLASTPSSLPSLCTSSRTNSSSSEHLMPTVATSPDDEKICPLITGKTDICNPDRCGPDAPCMNFTTIPPIEECTDVPCMTAPEEEKPKPAKPVRLSSLSKSSSRPSRQPSSDRLLSRPHQQSSRRNTADSKDSASKAGSAKVDSKSRAKQAHSLVEKKYRENLNAKLLQLHDTLRMAQYGPKRHRDMEEDNDSDEFGGHHNNHTTTYTTQTHTTPSNSKFRKGEVLDDALDYVNQTEVEMRHMENEIHRLLDLVGILENRLKYEDARGGKRMLGSLMTVGQG